MEKTTEFNLALGLGENTKYKANSMVLEPLDRLFLFTDGFSDAINKDELRYGDDRLEEVAESLRASASNAFINGLMKSVDKFAGAVPQFDDLTSLLVTFIERKS